MFICKKTNDHIEVEILGDSDSILIELHAFLKILLNKFYMHNQEDKILEEILDVVSDFADKHRLNEKGDKKDD